VSYQLVRAEIKTLLEGVTGIGQVHDYRRFDVEPDQINAVFQSTAGIINAWTIDRATTQAAPLTNTEITRTHRFVIRGYYELSDSTGSLKTFQALIESIEIAFRDQPLLSNTVENSGPLQVGPPPVQVLQLGVQDVHYCELILDATERVLRST